MYEKQRAIAVGSPRQPENWREGYIIGFGWKHGPEGPEPMGTRGGSLALMVRDKRSTEWRPMLTSPRWIQGAWTSRDYTVKKRTSSGVQPATPEIKERTLAKIPVPPPAPPEDTRIELLKLATRLADELGNYAEKVKDNLPITATLAWKLKSKVLGFIQTRDLEKKSVEGKQAEKMLRRVLEGTDTQSTRPKNR